MRYLALALVWGSLGVPLARAEAPARHALELDLTAGYDRMVKPSPDHAREAWARNGGPFVAGAVVYRSAYFLSPFLDVAYHPIYASDEQIDLGRYGGVVSSSSSLSAASLAAGAALDLWRVRLRAGIAAYDLFVRSSVAGEPLATSEIDMGYLFAVTAQVWRRPGLQLGIEARACLIVEADTALATLGVTAAGDAFTW